MVVQLLQSLYDHRPIPHSMHVLLIQLRSNQNLLDHRLKDPVYLFIKGMLYPILRLASGLSVVKDMMFIQFKVNDIDSNQIDRIIY